MNTHLQSAPSVGEVYKRRYEDGTFIVFLAFNEAAGTGRSTAIEVEGESGGSVEEMEAERAANKEDDWLMRQMLLRATGQRDPSADAKV